MFDKLIGNERAKQTLRRMMGRAACPARFCSRVRKASGKKLFAVELARALNCRSRRSVEACGECSSCRRIGNFETPKPDDSDSLKHILWSEHRDVGLVRPSGRFITIDAVRELERESNFRPYEGAARVFIIEGADRLNEAASNALLKTLEEVSPTTHLVLITSRPASLLPTIRSRSQAVRFAPLSVEELESHLVKNRQRAGDEARLAAHIAAGRPGVALGLNLEKFRSRRDAMLAVVEALTAGDDRVRLLRAAEEMGDAKNKDEYEPRLDVLEFLIHDLWLLAHGAGDARLVNYDLRERLARLAAGVPPVRAARWLSRVEELRTQLAFNVNRRVATDALFLGMASE